MPHGQHNSRRRTAVDRYRWHRAPIHRALSLLETTIAIAILGVGLIMVAAIFPAALAEHRESADQVRAIEMVAKAKAMLHNRLDATRLWHDPNLLDIRQDSPWLLIPFSNIDVGGSLVNRSVYSDLINGRSDGKITDLQLFGTDVLSDRIQPVTDVQANESANRLVWYGFYRQLASGTKRFTAAICKQRRNQFFYMQDLSNPTTAPSNPTPFTAQPQRFPVPWRVSASRVPGSQILFNDATAVTGLAQLAPAGARIMIQGNVRVDVSPFPTVPVGRILTVVQVLGRNTIQVREDISDLVSNDPTDPADNNVSFDFWLFPPAVIGSGFGNVSPLLEWKASL